MSEAYNLFNDIEDEGLRARNRGVILANIYEDGVVDGKTPPSGMKNLLSYFKSIPYEGRERAYAEFQVQMTERKYFKPNHMIKEV